MRLQYQITAGDEAVIYRVYGSSPVVLLPEKIGPYRVTAVGAYCFSDRNRVPDDVQSYQCSVESRYEDLDETSRELSGDFVEGVVLPDTVREIGNAAFFGCSHLKSLETGTRLVSIGSDVFNNCSRLKQVVVRGKASDISGIRHILHRISWEMEVQFEDAVLLYPEYSESYDTIAPAHIFGLSIEGEGFRARQCFRGDVVDFYGYDEIFEKACAAEDVETLGKMALNRLMTPVGLAEKHRYIYERFVRRHNGRIIEKLVGDRDCDRLEFLCRNNYADTDSLEQAVSRAVQDDWSEGAASLMEWKHRYYTICKKSRYEF